MTPHAESAERDCAGYAPGSARTILTSLSGGIVDHEGKKAPTVSVFAAAANACSGDVIELVAGDFALAGRAGRMTDAKVRIGIETPQRPIFGQAQQAFDDS